MNIPTSAKQIEVVNSTVPFYEDENYYYFDTSSAAVPEPMVNAVAGLELLDENKKLIMINHKIPMGLFPKIEAYFDYEVEELADGNVKIIFTKKVNLVSKLDFDTKCSG